jgi:phosphodiesterase/alkaline phosphatase D-like protein
MTYRVYSDYMGPSHPVSATTLPKPTLVQWVWSGALTEDSVTVKARLIRNSDDVHLLVSTAEEMRDAMRFGPAIADLNANDGVVTFQANGLNPGTDYFYAIEADSELDLSRQGHFETPETGVYSFTFAAASCALSGSNGTVFDAIRENDPLFFMATGDMFYNNISKNDPELYLNAYTAALTMPAQAKMRLNSPVVYMWDDHDFGPNNSDRDSPSKEAAQLSYRHLTPSYPLVVNGETGPVYHAFTVGRVRFIMTDLRSERSPASDPDNAEKTMFGEEQKAWFKQELLAANGVYPLIVWVQAVPWIANPSTGADHWGMYTTEREEIANFIADNDIEGILMISGDAHMLAIDDGTHSDYSTNGGGGFVVFHAAPLDRPANAKGGPYTLGPVTGGGQFGLITVEDTGAEINVTLSGRDYENDEKLHYEFTVPAERE